VRQASLGGLITLQAPSKLPVLRLPDGSTINGSANIIAWARDHAAA
jgi:hypothetical protein